MTVAELAWGLIGAALGWIVASVSAVARDVARRFLLKRAILSELRELLETTSRVWASLSRSLGLQVIGGVDNFSPLPLTHRVFNSHYPDALLVFSREQRKAMEQVHSYVEQVNTGLADLNARAASMADAQAGGQSIDSGMIRYGSKLRAVLTTAAQAHWSAAYYLRRPDFPVLEEGDADSLKYSAYLSTIWHELNDIEARAREFGRPQSDLIPERPIPSIVP